MEQAKPAGDAFWGASAKQLAEKAIASLFADIRLPSAGDKIAHTVVRLAQL